MLTAALFLVDVDQTAVIYLFDGPRSLMLLTLGHEKCHFDGTV